MERGTFSAMFVRVALLAVVGVGCTRSLERSVPATTPVPASVDLSAVPPTAAISRPRYLVGEVCYSLTLRAEHYYSLFAGGDIPWSSDDAVARAPLAARPWRFTVLGFDGEVHGDMVTAPDIVPSDPRGVAGDYTGLWSVGPCSYRSPDGKRGSWADCGAAGNCGIALATEGQSQLPPTLASSAIAQLCVANDSLIGDLDGDGTDEIFALEGFRGQAAVEGAPYTGAPCSKPRFAWYRMPVGADVIDVLGAVDLDRDGHLELLIAYTPAGGPRTVTLYTPAPGPARRLDRRAAVVR